MTEALLPFAVSAAVIVVAGTLLTRFGDQIATRSGLGRFLVGSLLIAVATALPELTIDIHAARLGNPDLAVGNLVGSSLFNLLILAIADLLHREPGGAFERRSIAFALPATASILVTSLAGMAILGAGVGLGIGRVGVGPLLILGGYLFALRLVIRDQQAGAAEHPLPAPMSEGASARAGWGGRRSASSSAPRRSSSPGLSSRTAPTRSRASQGSAGRSSGRRWWRC